LLRLARRGFKRRRRLGLRDSKAGARAL
jgi:hypothetical protein